MNSSEYLDSSQEYETLYPQTVMDTDSQDSHHHLKRPHHFYSPSHAKHFECFCGKIFISKADYNRHMLVHTGERPHECDVCGKAFSLKGNLTKHVLLHTEEKSYHCPECGKSFLKKGYIDQHMRVHTGEKPFTCPHCERAFSLKGNLAQHMKLHTDEKSYHCLQCNKLFLKKSYLVQHMRVHSGDKPHKCNLCNRAFNLKGNLVQHMKRHSGRKPFKCIECDKTFALKGALKEHEKIHGGDKPFVCTICSKAFNKKAYLTQHERTHTGERPFHCMECGKSFSQRSILNQHMKQHGERSYKCCQCHKIFLKKLSAINKALKNKCFTGFKCSNCEEPKSENTSDESLSGMFMKEEQSMSGYDPQSYIHDDNVSLYNLDSPQKSDELEKIRLKIARMEGDYAALSGKDGSPAADTNGLTARLYEFDTQNVQLPTPANPSEVRKLGDYNQKKVAIAHALSKENSKRGLDSHSKSDCANPMVGVDDEEIHDQNKKSEATYTELKVVEKHRLPSNNPRQVAIAGAAPIPPVKNGLSYSPVASIGKQLSGNGEGKVGLQSQSHSGENKGKSSMAKASEGSSTKKCMGDSEKGAGNGSQTADNSHVEKTSEKSSRNAKGNGDHPSKSSESSSKGKSLDALSKKHPSLLGIDSQSSSLDYSQRIISAVTSEAEESDARRALLYSQSALSDYRYIENLRDPFPRNFSSIRHGNVPEVESALSRFGIKSYYNSPWSFAGNYPE